MQTETASTTAVLSLSQAWHLVVALRPRQWAKNLLVYLAFFFTVGNHATDGFVDELSLFGRATAALLIFSLVSGAGYLVNDLMDMEADRLHPTKQRRPIAAGRLSPSVATVSAAVITGAAIGLAFVLDTGFGVIAVVYVALTLAYNLWLKDMALLDMMAVAGGFVLRAAAGALVIDVPISPWLYVMTSLGALLISIGKRRTEKARLGEASAGHRRVLDEYSLPFLDQLIAVVAPATVVAYTIYTFSADNLPTDNSMMLTIPFVIYGVFRYLFVLHKGNLGGSPEEIFLTDRPMLVNIILWLACATAILLYAR